MAMVEVRFDRMVPSAIVARRRACDLAYLPVGTLEWHGAHMPFGTDYMTAMHFAEQLARRIGGVVFPPLYYGDVRYHLHDCRGEWRNTYTRMMEIPVSHGGAFPIQNQDGTPGWGFPTVPDDGPPAGDPLPFDLDGQDAEFVRLIAKTLLEIHLYGFHRIVLLPGHGPQPDDCRKAEEVYRQNVSRRSSFGPAARTRTIAFWDKVGEVEPALKDHWTHACKWEGSLVMVAAPGTVRLDALPKDPREIPPAYLGLPYLTEETGYLPNQESVLANCRAMDPRNGTSARYGRKQFKALLKIVSAAVAAFKEER